MLRLKCQTCHTRPLPLLTYEDTTGPDPIPPYRGQPIWQVMHAVIQPGGGAAHAVRLSAGGGDAGISPYCLEAGDRGDGSRFTDLYRDFFGPTGGASCSASTICHVDGGTGFKTSGYECAPDQAGCWASMTGSIVPDGGTSMPQSTTLYKALRKAPPTPGSGPMPRNSSFAFCPADLERIATWIQNGAPND